MLVSKTSPTRPAAPLTKSKSPDSLTANGAKAHKTLSSWANPPSAKPTSHSHCSTSPADRKDYTAKFFRTDTLANHLAVFKHDDPARIRFLEDLHNTDVLVLDDFLTTPIDAATAHQLLNILAEREPRGSTIVTSQFTPDEWYKSIPDAVIAESILNRLVAGAEIITLEGTNMRLTP